MTHRAGPDPWPPYIRATKIAAAVLAVIVAPVGYAVFDTATEPGRGRPSPTLAIGAPPGPRLPSEYSSGGLANIPSTTTSPPPPAVVYEPDPAPVAVERVTPQQPPPTVVYVEVPVQVVPPPQYVAEIPEHADLDEPERDEGERKRHNGRGERHKPDKTTTPGTETDGSEKPSQVCVIGICVDGQERDKPTADDASDAEDQSVTESDNAGRKKGGKNRS